MTEAELRQRLNQLGPPWVHDQAARYAPLGISLSGNLLDDYRSFFDLDAQRVRWVQDAIHNPPFYADLLVGGADPRDLMPFHEMEAITFDIAVIVRPEIQLTRGLLFHELVHVVQYRLLGIDEFARLYIDGWLEGSRFRDDPIQRYLNVPMEQIAYVLQQRYETSPISTFSVEEEVRRFLG